MNSKRRKSASHIAPYHLSPAGSTMTSPVESQDKTWLEMGPTLTANSPQTLGIMMTHQTKEVITPLPTLSNGDVNLSIFCGCLVFCFLVLGVCLNAWFLYILFRNPRLRCYKTVLIECLSWTNLTMAVIAVPFVVVSQFSDHWIGGAISCTIHGFLMTALGMISIYLHTAVSYQRYVTICKISSPAKMRFTVIVTCLVCIFGGVLWAVPPLIGFSDYHIVDGAQFCDLVWDVEDVGDLVYFVLMLLLGLLMPVTMMMYCYVHIFIKLRSGAAPTSDHRRPFRRREQRVNMMLFFCIVGFVFTWTPYSIISFSIAFHPGLQFNPVISTLVIVLTKSSCVWNPILYGLSRSDVRHLVRPRGTSTMNSSPQPAQGKHPAESSRV